MMTQNGMIIKSPAIANGLNRIMVKLLLFVEMDGQESADITHSSEVLDPMLSFSNQTDKVKPLCTARSFKKF